MYSRFQTAKARNRLLFLAMALSMALLSEPAWAANITLQGTFGTDDAAQQFNVTVDTAGTVDIRSYGYAGGTTATGAVVPRGGFDTILTLFNASGSFINENDDGSGVATDAITDLAADARITANLTAGTYILTLTQYDNFSIGDLAAGFVETGHPNFTADPNFAAGGACLGNVFRDISGTDGRCRTGNWAVSFGNVSSVTPIAAVPEPSALLFTALGLGALLLMRIYHHQRRTKLLVGSAVVAIASASSALAQNPDFSNTDDILHGNRTMLNITDLQVVNVSGNGLNFSQLLTSNSSVTKTVSFPASLPGDIYNPYRVKSFSGLMFNQPQAVSVTEVSATQTASNSYLVTTNIQNAGPWFSGVSDFSADFFTAGAMADFNNNGLDDFAFSLNDGSIRIATAADVNNPWAGSSGPFKLGPASTVDVLTDMTAGDFKGDGQHEIAGLAFTDVDGIKLVIYTVDPTTLAISPASSFVFGTPLGFKIQYASIARGRFNTTTHDQLAVTFSSAAGPSIVQIIDFMPNTLTPNGGPQLTASTVSIPGGYLQVKTGKFGLGAAASNPYDQVVFHMSSESDNGRFFEILSVNPTDLTLTAHSGITYNQFPCASGIQVGNFDHQQTSQHDLDSQIALMYCSADATTSTMNIYSVDPQTFDVQNPPNSGTPLPIGLASVAPTFVATDLQGRSMVLGDPTKITINSTKPTIILAAPPMHVDYITPVDGNAPVVLNVSAMPSGFNSSFALSQDSKTSGTTTSKLSWSAGVDTSISGAYQVGDPDDGTGSRFSAGFHFASDFTGSSDGSTVNYSGSSYQMKNAAKTGDIVFFNDSRQNIWVYPVIGQTTCPADCSAGQKPLTVQFSGPDEVETGQTPASDFGAFWYQPPWEWGNVLSYPATKGQLALIDPEITDQTTFSNSVSFKPTTNSTSIEANWSAGQTQATSSSLANTTSFDVTTSYVSSWGISKIAKGKFSGSLKLSGSLGFAKLQENTAEVDASNGVSILSTAVFPDTSNYGYNVTPYILGNPPPVGVGDSQDPPKADIQTIGPLKTAFTANPSDSLNGGAWWSRSYAYATAPDIALNHPSHWVLSKPALTDKLPSNCGNTGQGQSDVDCFEIAPYYDSSGNPGDPWTSNFLSMRRILHHQQRQPRRRAAAWLRKCGRQTRSCRASVQLQPGASSERQPGARAVLCDACGWEWEFTWR